MDSGLLVNNYRTSIMNAKFSEQKGPINNCQSTKLTGYIQSKNPTQADH